uniref:Uncharacterized protein n=1 Tax=Mycena chlorophos TaxID=658473 RepID=A0ABQ0L7K1_MYCCL|nr:predicted protein [Mycena chlorophos]
MTDTSTPLVVLSDEQQVFLKDIMSHLGFVPNSDVVNAQLGKRKVAPPRNALDRGAFHQLVDVAKYTPRGADAFWSMRRIIEYGCIKLFEAAGDQRLDQFPATQRPYHHAEIFQRIFTTSRIDLLPVMRYLYDQSQENPGLWKALGDLVCGLILLWRHPDLGQMTQSARQARTQDTNTFKSNLHILLPAPGADYFFPPIEVGASKARRGLVHPQLRMLLMPWKDRILFPPLVYGKPGIHDKIVAGRYRPSSKRFPSFCYPDGAWNPNAYQQNLFQNAAIPRGLRLLLISRADASKEADEEISTGCLAAIHNIQEITPQLVGYVVVQIRLSMSNVPAWSPKESKDYKFSDLYKKVLDAFDDSSNPDLPDWAKETLQWLTERVFGDASETEDVDKNGHDTDSEDEATVQRAKRSRQALGDLSNVPWYVDGAPGFHMLNCV